MARKVNASFSMLSFVYSLYISYCGVLLDCLVGLRYFMRYLLQGNLMCQHEMVSVLKKIKGYLRRKTYDLKHT